MLKQLALAAAFAVCGSAAQADESFNVAIDGHCNTFSLNIQGLLVAGTRGGCGSGILGGTVARTAHQRGVIVSETVEGTVVTWYFTQPVRGSGKVFVFGSDGRSSTELGAGRYHIVHGPAKPRNDRSDMMGELPLRKMPLH